jgi:uncharacterized protein (TIGR03545 family)
MTISTDKAKTPKVKGPIRWEAVVPALIFVTLVGVYFRLFFDHHVQSALEYVGTQINGAEVDIGRLSTSFLGARLEMDNIQVTDKNKPERNVIQIGSIRFEMSWDALLRAKILVNQAKVLNIQALAPRKTPGYVVPPPPPSKGGPSALDRVQSEVLAQTRKRFNENFLADIASVLGGTDPKEQLKNLQAEFKSDARLKELEKELKEKRAKWEQRIKELPQGDEIKQYEARIKALRFETGNPAQFARSVKEADSIIKEIDKKVKLVDETSRDVKSDASAYAQAFKDLEKMVQEDIADLQKRLKIPKIDGKEFSQQLFMTMIEKRIGGVRKYAEVARQYMPPKRTAEQKEARKEEQLVPVKRGQGKTYRFPVTTGYPLFWLKVAALSSELGQSEYSGNIKGEIRDVTSDPPFIGKPTVIMVAGDFPKQNIFGFDAKITLDHTTEVARETATVKINRFPVEPLKFADGADVRLGLQRAQGTSVLNATLVNEELTMELKSAFNELSYDLEAKNKQVREILDAVLKGIPKIDLNATIKGSFHDLSIHVNSNLGDELAQGFKRQLDAKIAEAQAQLKKLVNDRIGGERDKLKEEMDKTIGGLTKDLDGKKAEVDKAVQQAKSQVEGEKGKGGTKKLEEEGKKLFKKFKLGG